MVTRSQESNAVRPIGDGPAPDLRNSPEAPPPSPGVDQLREIVLHTIDVLKRRRRVFYGVFGGVAGFLSLVILAQTPLYESTALMLVKVGRELVYQADIGAEQSFAERDKTAVINSELAILRSEPVLLGVVRSIGIDVLFPSLTGTLEDARASRGGEAEESREEQLLYAQAAEMLRGGLSTQALPDADVLQVTYQHEDPLVAAQTVNTLVDRFLDAHLSAFAEPEIVNFLEQRIEAYERRLSASETALREFATAHSAFALETPQTVLLERRSELRVQLDTLETQMAEIRLRHLQDDASVAEARRMLLQLEMEASQLRGRARSDVTDRIVVVEEFIEKRKSEIDEELEVLEDKRTATVATLAGTEAELAQLPSLSGQYRRLLRERDADEEQYSTYAMRLRNARLSNEMDQERIASINVIQPGSLAPGPIWPPPKATSLVIALVLALVTAVLAVTFLDRIGPTGVAWLDEEHREVASG